MYTYYDIYLPITMCTYYNVLRYLPIMEYTYSGDWLPIAVFTYALPFVDSYCEISSVWPDLAIFALWATF